MVAPRLPLLFVLVLGGCTQHGEPQEQAAPEPPEPPVAPAVHVRARATAVAEAPPVPETTTDTGPFTCTQTAYRALGRWTGQGVSDSSQDAARAQAEALACEAAGAKAGCVDTPEFMSTQTSSRAQTSFTNGEMTKHFEVDVTLIQVGESVEAEAQTQASALAACEEARARACAKLGFPECEGSEVHAPRPPRTRGLFDAPAQPQSPRP